MALDNKIKNIERNENIDVKLCISKNIYDKLGKISKDKQITIEELIKIDLNNLINYYEEQYRLIGLNL